MGNLWLLMVMDAHTMRNKLINDRTASFTGYFVDHIADLARLKKETGAPESEARETDEGG